MRLLYRKKGVVMMNRPIDLKKNTSQVLTIKSEPNILWAVWGMVYAILVTVLNLPMVSDFFPPGSMQGILFGWPLWGITYMIRDAIQYSYEDSVEKKAKSSGLWPSMFFVVLGCVGNLIYADPLIMLPSVIAFFAASLMDGWIFSKTRAYRLGVRLLVSNIGAGIVDTTLYLSIMYGLGHISLNIPHHILTAFMEVFPALIAFILGTTIFAKALGVVDFGIGRRINRG
jgi:hypothetical protein